MNSYNNPEVQKTSYYIGFAMAFIYFALGIIFLFTRIGVDTFRVYRTQAGLLFIAYALFRFYTTYKKLKLQK